MRASAPVWMVIGAAVVLVRPPAAPLPFLAAGTSSGARAIYEPLRPARLYDTRRAADGPAVTGPATRTVPVAGKGGVPADATAATLTVSVLAPSKTGYVIAYPAGEARPTVFTLSYTATRTTTVGTSLRLGKGGAVALYVSAGTGHVVVEVTGYYRGHDHDDRYLPAAEAQGRTAANAFTCAPGQVIQAAAADGAPVCVAADAHAHDDRYYVKDQAQGRTAPNALACGAGLVLQSVGADGTPACVAVDTPPVSPFLGIPSGSLTVAQNATVTLTNDAYYSTVVVGGGGRIVTNGYRLFVRDTLTMNDGSSISRNGHDGTAGAAGAALAPGTVGGGGAGACTAPAAGVTNSLGGAGHQGGVAGGAVTRPVAAVGGSGILRTITQALTARTLDGALVTGGSGGGGTGACDGAPGSGGGGSGGGVLVLVAGRIVLADGAKAAIVARGGSSAVAGGGGGGVVVVATQHPLPSSGLTVNASGGSGGPAPWGPGANGVVYLVSL